jgi:hypothetical protein
MVFWTKGCTVGVTSGIGIVSQISPDPEQWVWAAYRVMREVSIQIAEILALAMALRIAREECEKLDVSNRPSKVVFCSSARNALVRIQESDFVTLSGVRMPKAGVRMGDVGLVAANFLKELGIEVELRWIPDGCETEGALESNCAAFEGAKFEPPSKGPEAFVKDVQDEYKRRLKAKLRKREARQRKQNVHASG